MVFEKSTTENQLIRFVIAYLVVDNNVKHATVLQWKTPDFTTPVLSPPYSLMLWITGNMGTTAGMYLSEIC